MIEKEPLWVISCPLCDIIKNKNVVTKLYWPTDINCIHDEEFIIMDSPIDNKPIIIFRDHTDTILNENWGNMIYRCRKIFGESVRLKWNRTLAKDHFYCDIKV